MTNSPLPTVYRLSDIPKRGEIIDVRQPRIKFILGHVGHRRRVLDIGCFVGHYTNAMASQDNEVVGIDASPEIIAEARKRYPNIRFEAVDALELTSLFGAEEFDCVTASEVIEHVVNPDKFLANIYHVLKFKGTLVLTTQNSVGIQYRLRMLAGKMRWDPSHFRLYSKPELIETVKKASFSIQKAEILPINPRGDQKISRLFAYAMGSIYPNFGWTSGIVAEKR